MKLFQLNLLATLLLLSTNLVAEVASEESADTETLMLDQPQTGYISDQFYVPLRGSPCGQCKIIHKGLKSGTEFTILGRQGEWSLVTTQSGYEGWIRSQHISERQIARVSLQQKEAEIAQLQQQNQQLQKDIQRLLTADKDLRESVATMRAQRTAMSKELANIKAISAKELSLHDQNQVLVKQNHLLQEERDVLRTNVDDLRDNQRNESFMYGGLAVFLGAVLAAIIPRIRGRRRLSEWR
jgi:SH3 domain protein